MQQKKPPLLNLGNFVKPQEQKPSEFRVPFPITARSRAQVKASEEEKKAEEEKEQMQRKVIRLSAIDEPEQAKP